MTVQMKHIMINCRRLRSAFPDPAGSSDLRQRRDRLYADRLKQKDNSAKAAETVL